MKTYISFKKSILLQLAVFNYLLKSNAILSLIFFILVFIYVNAQNPQMTSSKLDSIENVIKTYKKQDTIRALTLITMVEQLIYTDPEKGMKYANEALSISNNLKWKRGTVSALRQKGALYETMSQHEKAIEYQLKSLKAMKDFDAPVERKKKFEAGVYINIGIIYNFIKDYNKAVEYYKKAEKILTLYKDDYSSAALYLNMGLTYLEKEDFKDAEIYLDKSYALAQKLNYINVYPMYFRNKGEVSMRQGKFELALKYFEKGLPLSDSIQDYITKQGIMASMGQTYFNMGNSQKALKYLEESMALTKFLNLPIERQNSESYQLLSDIYKGLGRPAEALEAYKKYVEIKENVLNTDKKIEISRKEMQYEADKKQALADAEIRRQKIIKNTIITSAVFAGIIALLFFWFYKKTQKEKQLQKDLLTKAKISDTEMKVLRLQLNPHFIFNSLNSIGDYIGKNDTDSADYYLSKFAKLMRGILENSEEKEIPIADELKMLELYMQLESSRLNHKFSYEIIIQEEIDIYQTMIPPLILQPFVENSIWHGLSGKNTDGKIIIEVTRDNDMLSCIVEDNGVGRGQNSLNPETKNKSYGLQITKDRIALLNKLKNTNASVHIIDLEKGTRVEVKLPFDEL